jgi:hypothetical protein
VAKEQLEYIGKDNSWQRLKALQLLTHYALLNPQAADCSSCSSAATRLCIELGLHRELPEQEQVIGSEEFLNTRRRLFWTSYIMDA